MDIRPERTAHPHDPGWGVVQPGRLVHQGGFVIFALSGDQSAHVNLEGLSKRLLVVGFGFLFVVSVGAGLVRKEKYFHSII